MTSDAKPLTDKFEILRLMADGWELGFSDGSRAPGRYRLQKPGLCRGGEVRMVHTSTARSMFDRGLIKIAAKKNDPFWLRRFEAVL